MIAGHFHQGSGLGNQLHRYVATRCAAENLGVDFGMYNTILFKGKDFMHIDMGKPVESVTRAFNEERVNNPNGVDIRPYDAKFAQIEDNTVIDGEFQDEKYWENHNVKEWLKVEPLDMPDDLCVIGFRGGEYVGVPDLFLPLSYWQQAIDEMKKINPDMRFEVHTDDYDTAKLFFPEYKVIAQIDINWRSVRYAHYLIIANSSFFIFPAWLNENAKKVIAPLYWARRNLGFWALPQNEYKKFFYI